MRVGPLIMLANAAVAFSLNIAAVFLVAAAGGLVLTLAGVFKGKFRLAQAPHWPPLPPTHSNTRSLTCPGCPTTQNTDILLITSSTVLFNATITLTQVFGYGVALGGLVLFKTSGAK